MRSFVPDEFVVQNFPIVPKDSASQMDDSVVYSDCKHHEVGDCPEKWLDVSFDRKGDKQSDLERDGEDGMDIFLGLSDTLMFCCVLFGRVQSRALVDTGCSCSIMSESLYRKLNLHLEPPNKVIYGLGGKAVHPLGKAEASFMLGDIEFSHDFDVVPDHITGHSVVLGNLFFRNNRVSVDTRNSKLSGTACWGSWDVYLDESFGPCGFSNLRGVDLILSCDIEVEYASFVLVPVVLPDCVRPSAEQKLFFDGNVDSVFLVGEPGVLSTSMGGMHVLLTKIKGSYSKERLKAGDIVGRVSYMVEADLPPTVQVNLAESSLPDSVTGADLDHLDEDQRKEVLQMMKTCSEVFSRGDDDIGCAGVTKHKIELYDDTPIHQKPRRFPDPVNRELERQCEELVGMGILSYSKSPWCSPIVPVRKKDGSLRICIDYRQLNKVTKADKFPIPNMSDIVFGLNGMSFFTTLDLVKGYYQVPMHQDSKEYTAFSTSNQHYEFEKLSFGLKNAPSAFQREMQAVLRDFEQKEVLVYIDDILIMSRSYLEHLQLVSRVLTTLANYHIKIKVTKCSWFQKEVNFLGHVVSQDGLRKSDSYMSSVRDYKKPSTVKQLRQFLGVVNFQRKFIAHLAEIAKPLTCLTGKKDKTPLNWTEDMDCSFDKLKEAMCSNIELAYPDYSRDSAKLELSTDASALGAGACLSQMQDGEQRVIAYASMTFSKAQCNYSTIERELAAIRWGINTFRSFLYGIPFILFTDHRPLTYMTSMSNQNSRIMRTLTELSEFDFEVRYKPGPENFLADTFSRLTEHNHRSEEGYVSPLPRGLKVMKLIAGGGDSMVQSICSFLQWYQCNFQPDLVVPTPEDLRCSVVDELLAKPTLYPQRSGRSRLAHIKLMKIPGYMPSSNFLAAFANLYDFEVLVYSEMAQPVVYKSLRHNLVNDSDLLRRVYLQCLSGIHYNPLEPTRLFNPRVSQQEPDPDPCDEDPDFDYDHEPLVMTVMDAVDLHCAGSHSSSSVPRIKVKVNGVSLCALLDTGAQISLLSRSVLVNFSTCKTIQVDKTVTGLSINTFGNRITAKDRVLVTVAIGEENQVKLEVTCVVVEEKDMACCMLLGNNVVMD